MSFDLEDARRFALARRADENPQERVKQLLEAYHEVLLSEAGRLMLEDLLEAYHHRTSAAVNEEASSIDHPFRAYYVEGQRSVVVALRTLASNLEQGLGEQEHDRPE